MPRSKQYNDKTVRNGLLSIFLEKGFSETSLVDMEQGSGLNRRQLYNDYGDKKSIFKQAITDFSVIAGERFLFSLEQGKGGVQDINKTLSNLIDAADTEIGRMGCLICNTASVPIAQDPEISLHLKHYFDRIQLAYEAAVKRAVVLAEIPSTTNSVSLSHYFLGVHISLCLLCKAGYSMTALRDIGVEAMKRFD